MSEETRRKMAAAQTGKHHSEETKLKIAAARTGTHHSEETKAKISNSHKGKYNEEYKRLLSSAMKDIRKKLQESGETVFTK